MKQTLRDIMDPKVKAAEHRLEVKRAVMAKRQQEVDEWTEKSKDYKGHALAELEERKEAASELKDADEVLAKAQREAARARDRYETKRLTASEGVQQYRYVETRFRGVKSKFEEAKPEVAREERGFAKMQDVQAMEVRRIDEAERRQKERLSQFRSDIEKRREGEDKQLLYLHQRYAAWQQTEKERASVVAQRK